MKLIGKTWQRIVISLPAGGIGAELIHISSGDPNRSSTSVGQGWCPGHFQNAF